MLIANGSFAHGISGTDALADSATGRKECHAIEKGKSFTDGQVVDTTHPWYGARVGIIGDSISDPKVANGPEKYYWYMAQEIGIIPCVVAQNGQQWN